MGMHGKKHSEETKAKMSAKALGRTFSEQHKKNLSLAHLGHPKPSNAYRWLPGDKCAHWKGGITPLIMQVRNCFQYRQWRSDVFTRDRFACIICGDNRGGNLQADHYPKRFAEIFHEYKIKSLEDAISCEKFWDVNNGRTLCVDCHKKHGLNGKITKNK